ERFAHNGRSGLQPINRTSEFEGYSRRGGLSNGANSTTPRTGGECDVGTSQRFRTTGTDARRRDVRTALSPTHAQRHHRRQRDAGAAQVERHLPCRPWAVATGVPPPPVGCGTAVVDQRAARPRTAPPRGPPAAPGTRRSPRPEPARQPDLQLQPAVPGP